MLLHTMRTQLVVGSIAARAETKWIPRCVPENGLDDPRHSPPELVERVHRCGRCRATRAQSAPPAPAHLLTAAATSPPWTGRARPPS